MNNSNMSPTSIRLNSQTKKEAIKLAQDMGLSGLSSFVNVLLTQAIRSKKVVLNAQGLTDNGLTERVEEGLLESTKGETIGPFVSTKDMFDSLNDEI